MKGRRSVEKLTLRYYHESVQARLRGRDAAGTWAAATEGPQYCEFVDWAPLLGWRPLVGSIGPSNEKVRRRGMRRLMTLMIHAVTGPLARMMATLVIRSFDWYTFWF